MDRRSFLVGLGAAAVAGPVTALRSIDAARISFREIVEYKIATDQFIGGLDIVNSFPGFVPKPEWLATIPEIKMSS
jgi:hypothetical protein